ncbi:polymeric immunoglobulin receptor-like [Pseudorasbora parva]|uniref:polymeric immunoglobulin receptor-like n=1 Tax=Pseudorasbora parva TaxID=51549 RepID=UPI00351F7BFF
MFCHSGPERTSGSASRELTVQTGGSVIIPCYYDSKYTEHKKYWCFHAKSSYDYCSILAYANETKGKVSVMDHPDQRFFTVTMRDLQNEDTGAYWCAVEIGGILQMDETEQLHLTVQSAPDVSVVSSSVSGHEDGNVSVQCFYSSGYQNKLKQWCRYKDQSCYPVGRTDTSQNSSVQISDDGRSSFTVLMTGLRLSDSGWYFCSAGDLQIPVQLTVTVPDVSLEDPHVPVLTATEPKPATVSTDAGTEKNTWPVVSESIPQTGGCRAEGLISHSTEIGCGSFKTIQRNRAEVTSGCLCDEEFLEIGGCITMMHRAVSRINKKKKKTYTIKMQREETLQLFVRRNVSLKFIVVFLWFITGPERTSGSASRELTVQTGGSVIIPCYYDRKYTEHKKYWCFHAKSAYNYCSILAYANETKGKVSVMDHPDQRFFTVTMRDLQNEDTGSYWCAVKIGGIFQMDEKEQLHLTVQSAPDVSVVSSSVSGHEDGNVSVQCFYSSGYQNKLKQWCRYKDQSCYPVGRTDTSQNSSVQISDDGRSSFTVLMTGLRLSDSGWYFCSAGDRQIPVQLTVTVPDVSLEDPHVPVLTATEPKPAVVTTEAFERNRDYGYLKVWIPVLLLLMLAVIVSTIILRKKRSQY